MRRGRSYTHSAGLFVMSATTNPSFAQSFVVPEFIYIEPAFA
jgi:hypothetical protein